MGPRPAPRVHRPVRLALLLLLASTARAQPTPDAVLDAWRADWRRAAASVDAVTAREASEWTVDGPRGRTRVEAEGTLRYDGDGPPVRQLRSVRVDGRDVDSDRGRFQGRRWERAFGPAGREVHAPPGLPGPVLAYAEGRAIAADRVGGEPAWRVEITTPLDRAEAWFTRADRPRLLALRVEGQRPRGGQIVREVRYTRVGGLDVPAEARTTFTARQRRRLREYFVTLTAVGTYTGHTVR